MIMAGLGGGSNVLALALAVAAAAIAFGPFDPPLPYPALKGQSVGTIPDGYFPKPVNEVRGRDGAG